MFQSVLVRESAVSTPPSPYCPFFHTRHWHCFDLFVFKSYLALFFSVVIFHDITAMSRSLLMSSCSLFLSRPPSHTHRHTHTHTLTHSFCLCMYVSVCLSVCVVVSIEPRQWDGPYSLEQKTDGRLQRALASRPRETDCCHDTCSGETRSVLCR